MRDLAIALALIFGVLTGIVQARALGALASVLPGLGGEATISASLCLPLHGQDDAPGRPDAHCNTCPLPSGAALLSSPLPPPRPAFIYAPRTQSSAITGPYSRELLAAHPRGPPAQQT